MLVIYSTQENQQNNSILPTETSFYFTPQCVFRENPTPVIALKHLEPRIWKRNLRICGAEDEHGTVRQDWFGPVFGQVVDVFLLLRFAFKLHVVHWKWGNSGRNRLKKMDPLPGTAGNANSAAGRANSPWKC